MPPRVLRSVGCADSSERPNGAETFLEDVDLSLEYIAQPEEHRAFNSMAVGSNPSVLKCTGGSLRSNPLLAGSKLLYRNAVSSPMIYKPSP